MTQYAVTVMIENEYWSERVIEDEADTADDAMRRVQARFDQAIAMGWATGKFKATSAAPLSGGV